MVGSSHACKLSALVSASVETKFLQHPSQSQTTSPLEDLEGEIESLRLAKTDFVYFDLLSNQIFMGTNEDGMSVELYTDDNRWHISGSLVMALKPRIQKILSRLECLVEACGNAKVVCGLQLPRYVMQGCCQNSGHAGNISEPDYVQQDFHKHQPAEQSLPGGSLPCDGDI